MKKFACLTLSLALAASLAAPAFAADPNEGIMLISAPVDAVPISAPLTYGYEITVNGVKLDTAKLPAADESYIPGRLVAESDHGSAGWYAEENTGSFYMDGLYVSVSFADNSITIDEKVLEKTAIVKDGVTYLPLSIFEGVEGYTVKTEENKIDIVTPNNDPLVKLAYSVMDATESSARMKGDTKSFFENFELDYAKNFESAVIFQGMNINPDMLLVGKLTKDADQKAIETALAAFRKSQEDTFSWYMSQHLEKVQAAKPYFNGGYVMFTICEDYDKAEEMFNSWVAEQK